MKKAILALCALAIAVSAIGSNAGSNAETAIKQSVNKVEQAEAQALAR